jgi:hypothetical protein
MRERLRKIAQLPPCLRIVFFREQANIVAQREQALEQGACFDLAVLQPVIVGKPARRRTGAESRRLRRIDWLKLRVRKGCHSCSSLL